MSVQQEAQVFALNKEKEKLQKELYSLKTHHQGVTTDKEQLLNQVTISITLLYIVMRVNGL